MELAPARRSDLAAYEEAAVAREIQEVQAAVIIAHKFPRNVERATAAIRAECGRLPVAERASFSFPRGGQTVSGASIRLLEVIAQSWGNLDFGFQILRADEHESFVQAYAWDLETNNRQRRQFTVKHIRDTRSGSRVLTDQRDIYELVANQAMRRVRAVLEAVIPRYVVDDAREVAERTLAKGADLKTAIPKIVSSFGEYDVTRDDLERRIGKRLEAMNPQEYVQLRKIFQSLNDGMSKKEDWFEDVTDPSKIKREQEAGGTAEAAQLPHEAKAAAADANADRAKATAELEETIAAVKRLGGTDDDVLKILRRPLEQVLADTPAMIRAARTALRQWRPKQ